MARAWSIRWRMRPCGFSIWSPTGFFRSRSPGCSASVTDTLCGTKVLRRVDYQRLKSGRAYFGDFDPFGDFDLIFGAAKLNLRCVEVPIRYAARTYGQTQISRFSHGLMLIRMVGFAFFRIKAL